MTATELPTAVGRKCDLDVSYAVVGVGSAVRRAESKSLERRIEWSRVAQRDDSLIGHRDRVLADCHSDPSPLSGGIDVRKLVQQRWGNLHENSSSAVGEIDRVLL